MHIVHFKIEKQTKGTLRFQEIDDTGAGVDFQEAKIGVLYVRKTSFKGGKFPEMLKVSIEPVP